jgi:hypothetical protein
MKSGLILLIVASFLWPAPASAGDVLLGRVVAVDREAGQFTLQVIEGTGYSEAVPDAEGLSQSPDEDNGQKFPEITVVLSDSRLPARLKPDIVVRVWGDFDQEKGQFVAQRLSDMRIDRTGVRHRLGRGRSQGGGMGHRGGRGGR